MAAASTTEGLGIRDRAGAAEELPYEQCWSRGLVWVGLSLPSSFSCFQGWAGLKVSLPTTPKSMGWNGRVPEASIHRNATAVLEGQSGLEFREVQVLLEAITGISEASGSRERSVVPRFKSWLLLIHCGTLLPFPKKGMVMYLFNPRLQV